MFQYLLFAKRLVHYMPVFSLIAVTSIQNIQERTKKNKTRVKIERERRSKPQKTEK